ncbi:MAG: hypothetical protein AAF719_12620 [Pseudomonadota bacterium]
MMKILKLMLSSTLLLCCFYVRPVNATEFNQWTAPLEVVSLRTANDGAVRITFASAYGIACTKTHEAIVVAADSVNHHDLKVSFLMTALAGGQKVRIVGTECLTSGPRVSGIRMDK